MVGAWQESSDHKWTWNKNANSDPALDKLWGHAAMTDPSQDPTGGPGHGAWQIGGKGNRWVWGADVQEDMVSAYGRDHLTDPNHFPTWGHEDYDKNKPPPSDVVPPTLKDTWNGIAPDVTGTITKPPDGSGSPLPQPPTQLAFAAYPGQIRDAEQGVLTTIDTTLTQYDSVKNAVANSVHNNVYQIGNQQDLLHSQDRLLLRVGDAIELAGQFTAALNNAAQMYARADIDSFMPVGKPTAEPPPK